MSIVIRDTPEGRAFVALYLRTLAAIDARKAAAHAVGAPLKELPPARRQYAPAALLAP